MRSVSGGEPRVPCSCYWKTNHRFGRGLALDSFELLEGSLILLECFVIKPLQTFYQ